MNCCGDTTPRISTSVKWSCYCVSVLSLGLFSLNPAYQRILGLVIRAKLVRSGLNIPTFAW